MRRSSGGVSRGDGTAPAAAGDAAAKLGGTNPWGSCRGLPVDEGAAGATEAARAEMAGGGTGGGTGAGAGAGAWRCGVRIRCCRRRIRASASLMLLAAVARLETSSSSSPPQLASAASISCAAIPTISHFLRSSSSY